MSAPSRPCGRCPNRLPPYPKCGPVPKLCSECKKARRREIAVNYARRQREKNPELVRQKARAWDAKNRNKRNAYSSKWRRGNPDRVRDQQRRRSERDRKARLTRRWECNGCGASEHRPDLRKKLCESCARARHVARRNKQRELWIAQNKERHLATNRAWWMRNRARLLALHRKYRRENPARYIAYGFKAYSKRITVNVPDEIHEMRLLLRDFVAVERGQKTVAEVIARRNL